MESAPTFKRYSTAEYTRMVLYPKKKSALMSGFLSLLKHFVNSTAVVIPHCADLVPFFFCECEIGHI